MARVERTPEAVSRAGLEATYALITSDNLAVKNLRGNVFLHCINTDVGAVVLTIHISKTVDGQAVTNKTVTLAAAASAGDEKFIGPFPLETYNQSGQVVWIDSDTADKVNVAVLELTT